MRILWLTGLAGCAPNVWNYRQLDCSDGQLLDLADGEDRPLSVRTTCAAVADEACVLKAERLAGAFVRERPEVVYAHGVGELELERLEGQAPGVRMDWGRAGSGADVFLDLGEFAMSIEGGRTALDPGPSNENLAVAVLDETRREFDNAFEVRCEGCSLSAVAPSPARVSMPAAEALSLCVDDADAEIEILVSGGGTHHVHVPRSFAALTLTSTDGATQVVLHGPTSERSDYEPRVNVVNGPSTSWSVDPVTIDVCPPLEDPRCPTE